MEPKEKASWLISEYTSICMEMYYRGGGGNKGCSCDGCGEYENKAILKMGAKAALIAANESLESVPATEAVENRGHILIPNPKMIYWQQVIEELNRFL